MILGMSLSSFTLFHVVLSLVGIGAGGVVIVGMLYARRLEGWTALFLATTVATNITGFMFHSAAIGPPHIVGAISLIVLAIALAAIYMYRLAGRWRWIYVIAAVLALYLNVFVGVAQAFQKLPFLHRLAPAGSEPPFVIAQTVVLLVFVGLGVGAAKNFRSPSIMPVGAIPTMKF